MKKKKKKFGFFCSKAIWLQKMPFNPIILKSFWLIFEHSFVLVFLFEWSLTSDWVTYNHEYDLALYCGYMNCKFWIWGSNYCTKVLIGLFYAWLGYSFFPLLQRLGSWKCYIWKYYGMHAFFYQDLLRWKKIFCIQFTNFWVENYKIFLNKI